MTDIIRGNDLYCGLEMHKLVAQDDPTTGAPTYPGTGDTAYLRVPFAGENLNEEFGVTPESEEITPVGALETFSVTQGRWRGSFRTLMYYNAEWFQWLMCDLMGGTERLDVNRLVTGVGAPGGTPATNVHTYIPQSHFEDTPGSQSGITWGAVLRIRKAGPSNTGSNSDRRGQVVRDMHVLAATFEWPEGAAWPTVTWEVEGQIQAALLNLGALATILSPVATEREVKPGDIGRDPSHPVISSFSAGGASAGTRNIMSASITVRNGLGYPAVFANSFNTLERIGRQQKLSVEARFTSILEQSELTAAQAGNVYNEWVGGTTEHAYRLRAISAANGDAESFQFPYADQPNNVPYALDIYIPNGSLRSMSAPLDTPGNMRLNWSIQGFEGSITSGVASTQGYKCPIMFQFQVSDSDDSDAKFATSAQGGQDPHTTLETP